MTPSEKRAATRATTKGAAAASLAAFFLTAALAGCGDSAQTHPTGFRYVAHQRSDYGLSPRVGDIMTLHVRITAPGDSLVEETGRTLMRLEKPAHGGGSIEDALAFMHRGDSMSFYINAANFYAHSRKEPAPRNFGPDEELRFDVRLADVQSYKQFEASRNSRAKAGQLEERVLLDRYLEKAPRRRAELDSALYYIPTEAGSGPKIKEGDRVAMHYLAYFVDGKPFGDTYRKNAPFVVTAGDPKVIEGLARAITGLQAGSKGTVVVPSYLGYGAEGLPDMVPPYSTLLFDIEILEIANP